LTLFFATMTFRATRLTFSLLLFLVFNKTTASLLKFQSSTNEIQSLLTQQMTMRCSLEDNSPTGPGAIVGRSVTTTATDVSYLTSLVLMKDGAEIAHVTIQTPAKAMNNAQVKVGGKLDTNNREKGYLEVTWQYPIDGDAGEFTCEANGMTSAGHNVVFSKTLEVQVKQPNTSDLVRTIHQLMMDVAHLEHVETGFIDCNGSDSWPGRDTDSMDGLLDGRTHRSVNVTQRFQRSYTSPPVVHLAVRDLHSSDPYFQFYVVNVDRDGFTMKCRGWNDNRTYQLSVSWVSIPK